MATYRFVPLRRDAPSSASRQFICDDDAAALALARRMMKGDACLEVWRGVSFVGHASAESAAEERAAMDVLNAIPAIAPSTTATDQEVEPSTAIIDDKPSPAPLQPLEISGPVEQSAADRAGEASLVEGARRAIARSRALLWNARLGTATGCRADEGRALEGSKSLYHLLDALHKIRAGTCLADEYAAAIHRINDALHQPAS